MSQWDTMLAALLAIFAIIAIGVVARRAGWLTQEADQSLFQLVVRVLLPALILDQVIGNPALAHARNLWLPPLVGFGSVVLGVVVALATARLLGKSLRLSEPRQQRTFATCVAIYNYGYVPLPLALALFGEETVGVLFVHNLGVEIALWTVGIFLLTGGLAKGWWRHLINPPALAIAAALSINGLTALARQYNLLTPAGPESEPWLPEFILAVGNVIASFVGSALTMLGACAIPMGVLLIGATISDHLHEAKLHQGVRVIAGAAGLRLAVLPMMFLAVAWLLVPASVELKRVMVLEAAMPAAVFPIVLARHYYGDVPTAVRVIVGTSLLSIITMPLWLSLGLWLLGLNTPT